jgi:UDP-N-acetylmuramate: L-alanyl-gamma-D-glutamyl-meso-diaminopimelate ligase
MNIHILGICGTFMAGIAELARQAGHQVSGSDENVYPPMSTQLERSGISLRKGYLAEYLQPPPDMVIVGNVMSRGSPAVEYLLNANIPYISGPQWLWENVLCNRVVLAVGGTHGKTSTASLLSWILESAGVEPGFLIGGVPRNFGVSARLGKAPYFIVEADEYDTAFFDKRSKFIHYHPRVLILNNLEFDHADIFEDLNSIKRQFHYLIRTVPSEGLIITNGHDHNLSDLLSMGCWTPCERFGLNEGWMDWHARLVSSDGSHFKVWHSDKSVGEVKWSQLGRHNVSNAMAAIAAGVYVGIPVERAFEAVQGFLGVKRRLEIRSRPGGITIYDDFAHHPTEIEASVGALRACVGEARVFAVVEPRSNSMRMGVHKASLANSLRGADRVVMYKLQDLPWSINESLKPLGTKVVVLDSINQIVGYLKRELKADDHVLIMSNGGFADLHSLLEKTLETRA